MPQTNETYIFRLTKGTREELEKIRQIISKEIGIDVKKVKYKHAEICLRLKASRGKIYVKELQDILLGKIK